MTRHGIIDMGSNSIRLCAYDISPAIIPSSPNDYAEVFNDKITAGLAAYVKNGVIDAEGIRRATDAANELIAEANRIECDELHIFATAVFRNASNSEHACSQIEEACGHAIDVLSGEREAELGVKGALLGRRIERATFMDLGGGSTEITVLEGENMSPVSIPQGTLSSFSMFVRGITPTAAEIETIAYCWRDLFEKKASGMQVGAPLYGIGGVLRAAELVYGTIVDAEAEQGELTLSQVEGLIDLYLADPNLFTHKVLPIVPERIHTLIPGCAILREVMRVCDADSVSLCRYGLREGYLADLLAHG